MRQFTLPDLGEGLEEAEIVAWHVNAGDRVVADQPLLSVETDKAVVEIPSPWSGRIAQVFGAKGDIIKVGAALVEFDEGSQQDAGTVVGKIDRGEPMSHSAPVGARASRPLDRGTPGASALTNNGGETRPGDYSAGGPLGQAQPPLALPAVRALARKLDVDLNLVQGTGAGGAITRIDVERAAKGLTDAGPAEPLKGMRRAMAQRMAAAHAEVVPTSVTDEADIDDWPHGEDLTMRLVSAIAAACAAEPALNVWYNSAVGERRLL
jgi:pyruvate dehydrogenase E2 component (dihydrolipoamide acetyltransferase)